METGTKKILANSQLEISSDLNRLVMEKIILHERKKMWKQVMTCCFLGLSTMGLIIFLLIRTMQSNPATLAINTFKTLGHMVVENQFIIIPFIVLLILQRMISARTTFYR